MSILLIAEEELPFFTVEAQIDAIYRSHNCMFLVRFYTIEAVVWVLRESKLDYSSSLSQSFENISKYAAMPARM